MNWRKGTMAALAALMLICLLWGGTALGQGDQVVYERAKSDYFWLLNHETARRVYSNWKSLADRFSRIFAAYPQGEYAAGSLYWMAKIYQQTFKEFNREVDYREAVDAARRLAGHFPHSNLADDTQMVIAELYEGRGELQQAYLAYLKVTVDYPHGDMVSEAKARLDRLERDLNPRAKVQEPEKPKPADPFAKLDPGLAAVTELRHWSTSSYTRVVMSLERPVPYKSNLLKRDKDLGKPRRLYLDLSGARLTSQVAQQVPIGDGLLRQARAGQFTKDTVRLVLDISDLASYKVFTLDNPFRVVIDCFGHTKTETPAPPKVALKRGKGQYKVPRGQAKQAPPPVGLAAQLGLGIRRVVLDPGHGGKDPGAHWQNLYEKEITLDVARRTRAKLRKMMGVDVLMTRNNDTYLPLEDRTAFANTRDADLFVSFHVNAAPSHRLKGVETYFLNLATDAESMRVAARENATTQRSISDLQVILNDLMMSSKVNESNRLARILHQNLLGTLRRRYQVKDLKVKQAPFYVLIGARMPSILCEVGFITNPAEHKRLASTTYREQVAEGIARGIMAYAQSLKVR